MTRLTERATWKLRITKDEALKALDLLIRRYGVQGTAARLNTSSQNVWNWKHGHGPGRAVCAWIDAASQLDDETLDRIARRRVLAPNLRKP